MCNTSRIPVGTPLWPRAPATGAKAHAGTKEVAGPWGFESTDEQVHESLCAFLLQRRYSSAMDEYRRAGTYSVRSVSNSSLKIVRANDVPGKIKPDRPTAWKRYGNEWLSSL